MKDDDALSHPLRRIDVDPKKPIRDIVSLLANRGDAIEIRIGDRLSFILRIDDEATETNSAQDTPGHDEN